MRPTRGRSQSRGGEVRFEHVSFGYDPQRGILFDVDFSIPAGKTVAVVGTTGAGKSTLARLLYRFYDVDAGRILIDGQDIRAVTQDSLRAAIGIVPQDTVLFNDTIYYNIAYGDPTATRDEIDRGGAGGAHPRFHREPAARLRHGRRRARPQAVRRREAARRDRAHAAQGSRDPRLRRGDERARYAHRKDHPGRTRGDRARTHDAGHRAPAVDDRRCRRDPRARARPHRRTRHTRRTARAGRPLCPALAHAARAQRRARARCAHRGRRGLTGNVAFAQNRGPKRRPNPLSLPGHNACIVQLPSLFRLWGNLDRHEHDTHDCHHRRIRAGHRAHRFASRKHRHKLSAPWESGEAAHADLLVVDIESMYGQMDWLRARSRGRLVIAYTSATEPLEPEFSLRKPVVSADLVTLLNRISENMGNGPAQAAPMHPANSESYEAPPVPQPVVRLAERKPVASVAEPKPAAVVEAPAEIRHRAAARDLSRRRAARRARCDRWSGPPRP